MCDVALVAGEGFVPAVARQCNGDMTPRLLGDQEGRERGLVAERLVEGRCQARQSRGDVILDLHLLVHRAVPCCDRACVRSLVVARIRKPDGERAHGL